MADLADQNRIVAAQRDHNGVAPDTPACIPEGDAASTEFNHFAERVLPTLKQLRLARQLAETLAGELVLSEPARIGRFALESMLSIDATLRMTGVYDLSELAVLESDATRMNAVCRVLDEVGERLHALARALARQMEHASEACDTAALTALLAALTALPDSGSAA